MEDLGEFLWLLIVVAIGAGSLIKKYLDKQQAEREAAARQARPARPPAPPQQVRLPGHAAPSAGPIRPAPNLPPAVLEAIRRKAQSRAGKPAAPAPAEPALEAVGALESHHLGRMKPAAAALAPVMPTFQPHGAGSLSGSRATEAAPPPPANMVFDMLRGRRAGLAVILAEVLGPPKALRDDPFEP